MNIHITFSTDENCIAFWLQTRFRYTFAWSRYSSFQNAICEQKEKTKICKKTNKQNKNEQIILPEAETVSYETK